MTGDLIKWTPGDRVPVERVADASGNVPTRGKGVEIVGESRGYTQVQLTQGPGSLGIGHMTTDPDPEEEQDTYAEGDVLDEGTVYMHKAGILVDPADGYDPSVTDEVAWTAGGDVEPYDEAAAGARPGPMGVVFSTAPRDFVGDKIVVARLD